MARVFAITAASDSVRLDRQGRGEISFTVSNTTHRTLTGRISVVASEIHAPWLSIQGESERELAAEGTDQVVVKIKAPPGAPAGKISFFIKVVSIDNTDEDWTDGQSVAVEVPPSEPDPKPFPWLILIIILVVLLVTTVMIVLLTRNGDQPGPAPTPRTQPRPTRFLIWTPPDRLHFQSPTPAIQLQYTFPAAVLDQPGLDRPGVVFTPRQAPPPGGHENQ